MAPAITPNQLQHLAEVCRQDPASPAFVELGTAYLTLGRPQDTIEVGARGLRFDPSNLAGRLMVAEALVQMHQWKPAQVELLKVVKSDRQSRDGFRMLGEVLLRRDDFERAIPVLQHAQNLDPANRNVLELLRRARAGQGLDPPPPVPEPSPLGGAPEFLPGIISDDSEDPTSVLEVDGLAVLESDHDSGPGVAPARLPSPPRPPSGRDARGGLPDPQRAVAIPPSAKDVRPRVLPTTKPTDAAKAPLLEAAKVDEDYLNKLLSAGLLTIPNVQTAQVDYSIEPDHNWGRSSVRMFATIFVLFAIVGGSGIGWFMYAGEQRKQDVANHVKAVEDALINSSYADLELALDQAEKGVRRDRESTRAIAVFARVGALSSLLYGTDAPQVETVVGSLSGQVTDAKVQRDLLFAKSAITLSRFWDLKEGGKQLLGDIGVELDAYLKTNKTDTESAWATWFSAQVAHAQGQPKKAILRWKALSKRSPPMAMALVSLGDQALDRGDFSTAIDYYAKALKVVPDHTLAVMGRALARAEHGVDIPETLDDLNVGLARAEGRRIEGYRNLATAFAHYALEDYSDLTKSLKAVKGSSEPRFLARVALGWLLQGNVAEASKRVKTIRWYGDTPPPLVPLVDAELWLANGAPARALSGIGDLAGVRAAIVRGRAKFALGRSAEAIKDFNAAIAVVPEHRDALVWKAGADMVVSNRLDGPAAKQLGKLRRGSKTKVPIVVHGLALWQLGKVDEAVKKFEESVKVEEEAEEYPNPLAYVSHTLLATRALDTGKSDLAKKHVESALKANGTYFPAIAVRGRALLADRDFAGAVENLAKVVEAETADGFADLSYAEALVRRGKLSADDKKKAIDAVKRAANASPVPPDLARVAYLVSPSVGRKLGLREPR